ncbi:tail fiber assembly protein [Escherichia coli]|uniref:tail fiber assembly protein n=1 Tax=Serratia sarumanii TaxID=3020826 RepID=UPI001853E1BA|nr:tail fiber assembly protein [Escherichia coli]
MYLYSAQTNAFYPLELKDYYESADTLPNDVIEVTDDVFYEYSEAPEGKYRQAGPDGLPAWKDIPPPTQQEQIAAADAEKQSRIDQANEYMNSKQWPGKAAMGRLSDADKAQYNAWLDYLDELEGVDTSVAPDITWPDKPE